jgi:hypothetical protein
MHPLLLLLLPGPIFYLLLVLVDRLKTAPPEPYHKQLLECRRLALQECSSAFVAIPIEQIESAWIGDRFYGCRVVGIEAGLIHFCYP